MIRFACPSKARQWGRTDQLHLVATLRPSWPHLSTPCLYLCPPSVPSLTAAPAPTPTSLPLPPRYATPPLV